MFDWFRDKTRDKICAELQSLGVNARMAVRGRPEEETGEGSLGIIEIAGGPIPWVNVRRVEAEDDEQDYYTDFGVEVPYNAPNATVTAETRAQMKDVEWWAQGSDWDSPLVADVLRRLREDTQVTEAILATRDVEIIGSGSRWVITLDTEEVPTRQEWDCYQAIARHLIAAKGEEPNTD